MSCSGHKLTYGKVVHCNGCPERWGTKVQAASAASQAEVSELKADVERLTRERDMQIGYRDTRAMERDAAKDELATKRAEVAALRRSLTEADTAAASLERARGLLRNTWSTSRHPFQCICTTCEDVRAFLRPPTPIATPGRET